MKVARKLKRLNCRIIIFLIVFILTLEIIYISVRKSYYSPFKWNSHVKLTSGLYPNTTNILLYNNQNPNNNFPCLETVTTPSFEICIYSRLVDEFISRDLEDTGLWEPCITRTMQQVLELESNSIFIDIGANIGYYSLLAAKSGHYVISVEPVINHIERLHTAVHLNDVDERVVMVRNGMAGERREATVRRSGHNQGDSQLEMAAEECRGSCPPTVKTILLNDLTHLTSNLSSHLRMHPSHPINISKLFKDVLKNSPNGMLNLSSESKPTKDSSQMMKPPSVILKLDTQGFEHQIFTNADSFFQLNHLSYIFMEWISMKEMHQSIHKVSRLPRDETFDKAPASAHDEVLIDTMISFLHGHDFFPYSNSAGTYGRPLNPALWSLWPNDLLWVHRSRLHELRNIFERSFLSALFKSSVCA